MPPKDARCQKERRNCIKKDKEEKRRLGRIRWAESEARRKACTEFDNADVAVEVVGSMEVEEKEDENDDDNERKWNIGDYVVLEDISMSSPITVLSIYVLEFSQQDCFLRDE